MSKWVELPIQTVTKNQKSEILGKPTVLTCALSLDPPAELVPDIEEIGVCYLTTVMGTKRVELGFKEALERLRAD